MSVVKCGVTTVRASSVGLPLTAGRAASGFAGAGSGSAGAGWVACPAHAELNPAVERANARTRKTRNIPKIRECLFSVSRSHARQPEPTQCGNLKEERECEIEHCFSPISPENTHLQRGL